MGSGLEHVRLEDAVRDADVSRTAAYRCWPNRDDFLVDVLAELAGQALPVEGDRGPHATAVLRASLDDDPNVLRTAEGRRAALRKAVAVSASDDLITDRRENRRWQLYLALAMAVPNLPEGPQRDRVSAAVTDAESQVLQRLERNYRKLLELFGFTSRVEYRELAEIGIALMRGYVIGSYAGSGAAAPGEAYALLVDGVAIASDTSNWDAEHTRRLFDELDAYDAFATE